MSTKRCHGCGAYYSVRASACPECGALANAPRAPMPEIPPAAPPTPSAAEAQAAYRRARPALLRDFGHGARRTRASWIEHWQAIAADPHATPIAHRFAAEALRNLAEPDKEAEAEREPGEDREEETERESPAAG